MGTFEKLGILVIVIIIVMILAVAIYQWGGTESDSVLGEFPGPRQPELSIIHLDDLGGAASSQDPLEEGGGGASEVEADPETWRGGVPRSYVIQRDDVVWKLVVQKWRLEESFIQEIAGANPGIDMKRIMPGTQLTIPDPSAFVRGASSARPLARAGTRAYEVQIGDSFGSIAREQLGDATRWQEIQDLNPGMTPKRIRAGATILIPAK